MTSKEAEDTALAPEPLPSPPPDATGRDGPLSTGRRPLVAGGAVLGALLVRHLAPDTGGHGTDAAIKAIHREPRGMRGRITGVKTAAAALTLGTGGSGGTEGPAAQISATFGSVSARVFRLDDAGAAGTAGLAAGVGAISRHHSGVCSSASNCSTAGMAHEMLIPRRSRRSWRTRSSPPSMVRSDVRGPAGRSDRPCPVAVLPRTRSDRRAGRLMLLLDLPPHQGVLRRAAHHALTGAA